MHAEKGKNNYQLLANISIFHLLANISIYYILTNISYFRQTNGTSGVVVYE